MKTVRFAALVEKAGAPEVHLLLVKPEADAALQKAIAAHRVLTVKQTLTGAKADAGEIGFHPGPARQYLIFPKSLHAFADRRVVGVKYDLLDPGPAPPRKKEPKPKPAPKPKPRQPPKPTSPPPDKVVAFPRAEPETPPTKSVPAPTLREVRSLVRRAMRELEHGRQVAAFRLLEQAVQE